METEKTKLMSEANEYNQAKASLTQNLSSAMEQFEVANTAITAAKKRLQQIDTRVPLKLK